jgi:uracil phosphoribosyltransferase
MALTIVEHPLIAHKLTILRDVRTAPDAFRRTLREIGAFLAFEATRDLETAPRAIETPLEPGRFASLAGPAPCFVSILRAGNGLLDGALDVAPNACVGHVGLYRNEETLEAVQYYLRLPPLIEERAVIVLDPMLATGGSAVAAIARLKEAGARRMKFCCLVAAPEGVDRLSRAHGDVDIIACALDRGLNEKGYILPGLGDAGDRLYAT